MWSAHDKKPFKCSHSYIWANVGMWFYLDVHYCQCTVYCKIIRMVFRLFLTVTLTKFSSLLSFLYSMVLRRPLHSYSKCDR